MKRNFSESATVDAHRADGIAARPPGPASRRDAGVFTKGFPVLHGTAATFFVCMSIGFAGVAPAVADPGAVPVANGPTDPVADAGPPPPPPVDDGHVASTPPVTTKFPDGWTLTVSAHDETEMPVPSLTDEAGTSEYIVGGVFNGSVHAPTGAGAPRGTFEVGYQTACQVDTQPPAHLTFGIGPDMASDLSLFGASVVTTVPVDKADFNGTDPWVMVSGFSIKIDGGVNGHTHLEDACVGQSFIRSYATLTASTDTSNVTVSYYGTIKAS